MNTQTTFTPGPWHVEPRTTRGEFVATTHIVSGDESHIAVVQPCAIEANARLIAAAPELLAALVNLLDEDDGPILAAGFRNPFVTQARAAIAKATE